MQNEISDTSYNVPLATLYIFVCFLFYCYSTTLGSTFVLFGQFVPKSMCTILVLPASVPGFILLGLMPLFFAS